MKAKYLWPFRAKRGMAWQFGAAPQTAAGAHGFLHSVSTIPCRCRRYKRLFISLVAGLGLTLALLWLVGGAQAQSGPTPAIAIPRSGDENLEAVTAGAAAPASAPVWRIERVTDSAMDEGRYTSLALDGSGAPHISYCDETNDALKYTTRVGRAWVSQTVDSVGSLCLETSLAVEMTAPYTPHISYYDWSNGDLKYATLADGAWVTQTVDGTGNVGRFSSLALDGSGSPRISYWDWSSRDLKYAAWTGSAWVTQTVDSTGEVGWYTSLALEPTAFYTPHISYFDFDNWTLKYATWTGSGWVSQTVDSGGSTGTSLALNGSGNPRIGYSRGSNLKYATWTGSGWVSQTVDCIEREDSLSLALDGSGNPHIGYYCGGLKHATWTGSGWVSQTVDNIGMVGWYTSLAVDGSGVPHISYYDETNQDLKYARRVDYGVFLPIVMQDY